MEFLRSSAFDELEPVPDVSIVMPCLNEAQALPHCIDNARAALREIQRRYGLSGELVIADNGSTDGSQQLALNRGARVIAVSRKGYGAAIIGGFEAARGRFLVMGDADGSYDFHDSVAMVGKLMDGADLCMGSRFMGGIAPGAMPWKNRYIGNPVLTGILNLFFRCGIGDAHCGLRAIRKDACVDLNLQGAGMEFASEMVIKASMKRLRIDEVLATLSPDLRDRPPHLRPWRDGWRHLRFLLMFSPTWVYGVPAIVAIVTALAILFSIALHRTGLLPGAGPFGASWTIVAGFLLTVGHFAGMMAIATHLYGVKKGYRSLRPELQRLAPLLTLEHALLVGSVLMMASLLAFGYTGWWWVASGFDAPPSVLPVTVAAAVATLGLQTIFGGFLMAIMSGHDSRFIAEPRWTEDTHPLAERNAA